MRVAVLADTHIPKRAKNLPDGAWQLIRTCDVIIHAGDVLTNEFLKELESVAPTYAVLGNNDVGMKLPATLEIELQGARIAVIHDSGDKVGRGARMKKKFPNADMVVFGHSHIPMDIEEAGIRLFNPGSPTDRRMQPQCTMGVLEIHSGAITTQIVAVS